jgi:crotonobetainyl-CoA:carnitine CoA-transferase CaiB-like acyl-CoA transferase
MTALTGLRIIETAERVCGEWAARLLADLGAEVIKIERPGGSPTRRHGPHVAGESTLFAYCNTNKKSVVLDLSDAAARARLGDLLATADALIDDHDNEWCRDHALDAASIRDLYPALVHCRITPFGADAPPDRQRAFPINIANAGGWAWHTPSEAAPSEPPLMGAGRFMPDYDSGLDAAMATAASLLRQRRSGAGQSIDVSEWEVQLSRADIIIGRLLAGDDEPTNARSRYDMGGPGAQFACRDGYVHLYMTTARHWSALCKLMGNPDWASDYPKDWLEFHCTRDRVIDFRQNFAPWIADKDKVAITDAAQALGIPLAPVNTPADLLANVQYRHRGYFQPLDHPVLGPVEMPTVPYRMSASPAVIVRCAPVPDADRAEVLG